MKNFLIELEKIIKSVADDLIEESPEDYNPKFEDYGWYNNGVGMACCGGEWTYNEEKAHADAVEKIADSIDNGDFELLIKEEFCHALAEYIRSR